MFFRKGFSLIELMVVIAIVALLSAVALPSYKAYQVRTNMASVYGLVEPYKNQIIENYNKTGSFALNGSAGTYDSGVIPITGSSLISAYGYYTIAPTNRVYIHLFLRPGIYPNQPTGAYARWLLVRVTHNDVDKTYTTVCGYDSRGAFQIADAALYVPANCNNPMDPSS